MKKSHVLCLLLALACIWLAYVPAEGIADADFEISGDVLTGYRGSASTVYVPDGVRVIGGGAFAGNRSISTVVLPGSVREISGGAFRNCANLQYVISGGSLSVIGGYAFDGCPKLNTSFRYDVANVSDTAFGEVKAVKEEAGSNGAKAENGKSETKPSQPAEDAPAAEETAPSGETAAALPQNGSNETSEYTAAPDIWARLVSNNAARIQWMPVMYATGYELYRSVNSGEPKLLCTLADTAYTDDSLNFAKVKTYSYFVKALLSIPDMPAVTETGLSREALVGDFPAPAGVSAWQNSASSASVCWDPVNLATSYEIYRSANGAEGEYALVKTVSAAEINKRSDFSYTDSGLDFSRNTYCYKLRAVLSRPDDGVYIESGYSEAAAVEETFTALDVREIEENGLVYITTPEGAVVSAYKGGAENLTIPSKIQYGNREYTVIGIGPGVFRYNTTLKSIKLPSTLKYIETAAFAYCSAFIDR
ncbi:MAG: leucine-rich repeat protein [Clostridia bacterium]|nr:leucine-rich repeat protein [Clostridia bacterium]